MNKQAKCQFKKGDRVIATGSDSPNCYRGTFLGIEHCDDEEGWHAIVEKDEGIADWLCNLDKDGRVATAHGAWDGKTYLKKLTPEQEAIEKMQR